jgi:hypothetical protein
MDQALMQAAQQRLGGGSPGGGMMGASAQRVAGGDDPGTLQRLIEALKRWYAGLGGSDEETADASRKDVDRAALDTLPEATGMPGTLNAIDQRRKMYQDIDEQAFR